MDRARTCSILAGSLGTLHTLGSTGTLTDGQLLDRFLDRRDPAASDAAFRILVERHGPMVLSACRQRLDDPDDAQDAFQATFLVLVQRAASIRNRRALGGWLFVAARRVAERARTTAARRRQVEQSLGMRHVADRRLARAYCPAPDASWSALYEEIERLPWMFRDPLVLHYFEGQTAEAIAIRLGCPRGTVLSRLARARRRLKSRLEHKGIALGDLITPAGLAPQFANPLILPSIIESTTRLAGQFLLTSVGGHGLVPAAVSTLVRSASQAVMLATVRRTVLAAASAFVLIGLGVGLLAKMAREQDLPPAVVAETAVQESSRSRQHAVVALQSTRPGQQVEIRGRVVDPKGQPVQGARIVLDPKFGSISGEEFGIPSERAVSGTDGRFSFAMPCAEIEALRNAGHVQNAPAYVAVAPGRGTAWVDIPPADSPAHDLVLQLPMDDIPINGRLLDQEARPLAGVRASVFTIIEPPNRDVREFVRRVRSPDRETQARAWDELRSCVMLGFYDRTPSAVTNAHGEFLLTGVGRDRLVLLELHGAMVADSMVMAMTTSESLEEPLSYSPGSGYTYRVLGPRFEQRLPPGRELAGTIHDRETGEPLAGIRVLRVHDSDESASMAISDAQGRYRLTGQPFSASLPISFDSQGLPYFSSSHNVTIPPGTGAVMLDLALVRGVVVEGRVIDRATSRPVRARIGYFPLLDNPIFMDDHPATRKDEFTSMVGTDMNGHFRLVALPGTGLLGVLSQERGYLTAPPPDGELTAQIADREGFESNFGSSCKQYRRIEIPGSVKTITAYTRSRALQTLTQDFALEPGHTVEVHVDGPEGKPLASVRPLRTDGLSILEKPDEAPLFHYVHEDPGKSETLLFLDHSGKLGSALTVDGLEERPIHLVLRPTGTVSGRLVDEQGKPRAHVLLEVSILGERNSNSWLFDHPERVLTGADGIFHITGVIPDIKYRVDVPRTNLRGPGQHKEGYLKATRWSLQPGESVNWGDVRVTSWNR